jgi:hypothetical protein
MRRAGYLSLTVLVLICIGILAVTQKGMTHPFYISVCQVDHNSDIRMLEITVKIFIDDLEQTLEAQGTGKLHLGTDRESDAADRYIARYLEQHVLIEINGRTLKGNYLGKETELDVIWCYVEMENVPSIRSITVTNTLLIDLFEDQTNMVHIKANGQKKSMLLTRDLDRDTVEF